MTNNLTLSEFLSIKKKLDKDILNLLHDFNSKTGLVPDSVDVDSAYSHTFGDCTNSKYLVNVTTTFTI